MLDTLMAAGGGAAGGMLGQLGQTLSAPRRGLMNLMGLPDQGNQLVGQSFGMDPESGLARILGMGADMAFDPLTYAGMMLPGAIGAAGRWLEGPGMSAETEALLSARQAAQEALLDQATLQESAQNLEMARMGTLANSLDVPSLVDGNWKTYQSALPGAASAAEGAGLGVQNQAGGLDLFGGRPPQGMAALPQRAQDGTGRMMGSALGQQPGAAPLPQLSPYERYLAMSQGQEAGGGAALSRIDTPTGPQDILNQIGQQQGQTAAGQVGLPNLSQAMYQSGMPMDHIAQMGQMGLGALPADQGFQGAQSALAQTLAQQQAQQQHRMLLGAGGLGAAGGAAGAYLANR